MTSGFQGTRYLRRYDRELAGFKTGDFVEEQLEGATVEPITDVISTVCLICNG